MISILQGDETRPLKKSGYQTGTLTSFSEFVDESVSVSRMPI